MPCGVKHPLTQETQVPVYVGLMIHSVTRNKQVIEKCHKMGLSVGYDRVLQLSNKVANSVCEHYRENDIARPLSLQHGTFTVAAADNIDHNLTSSTTQTSFHGTAVYLMQSASNCTDTEMTDRTAALLRVSDCASDLNLPGYFTNVQPCVLRCGPVCIRESEFVLANKTVHAIAAGETEWLETVHKSVDGGVSDDQVSDVSWAAFHAGQDQRLVSGSPVTALLPLLRYNSNTAAMMKHALLITQKAVSYLHPDQVPVIFLDQPLFALAKQVQWYWPDTFGECKFVVMMGGLHIEMASLRTRGHWLDGSGWLQCLVAVADPGGHGAMAPNHHR